VQGREADDLAAGHLHLEQLGQRAEAPAGEAGEPGLGGVGRAGRRAARLLRLGAPFFGAGASAGTMRADWKRAATWSRYLVRSSARLRDWPTMRPCSSCTRKFMKQWG
jgi:hypothetical protein